MSKLIEIPNVPDGVLETLEARATTSGMSLSEYLLREIEFLAQRPTEQELLERLATRGRVKLSISSADAVRQERDSR